MWNLFVINNLRRFSEATDVLTVNTALISMGQPAGQIYRTLDEHKDRMCIIRRNKANMNRHENPQASHEVISADRPGCSIITVTTTLPRNCSNVGCMSTARWGNNRENSVSCGGHWALTNDRRPAAAHDAQPRPPARLLSLLLTASASNKLVL